MKDLFPVLVVEDEELLLSILKVAVERGGATAVGASSGAEALELLAKHQFSAVVTDLRMPGKVGGAEIYEWVGRNRPELTSRFLFVTGNAQDPLAQAVQQSTGATFVEKPFRITHLTELVKNLLWPGEALHA